MIRSLKETAVQSYAAGFEARRRGNARRGLWRSRISVVRIPFYRAAERWRQHWLATPAEAPKQKESPTSKPLARWGGGVRIVTATARRRRRGALLLIFSNSKTRRCGARRDRGAQAGACQAARRRCQILDAERVEHVGHEVANQSPFAPQPLPSQRSTKPPDHRQPSKIRDLHDIRNPNPRCLRDLAVQNS